MQSGTAEGGGFEVVGHGKKTAINFHCLDVRLPMPFCVGFHYLTLCFHCLSGAVMLKLSIDVGW